MANEVELNSILGSVKQFIGIDPEIIVPGFENNLIMDINSALFILWQHGAGDDPSVPFKITGSSEVWDDFVTGLEAEACKSYVCVSAKLDFDPPSSSYLLEQYKLKLREYESRIIYAVDEKNAMKN